MTSTTTTNNNTSNNNKKNITVFSGGTGMRETIFSMIRSQQKLSKGNNNNDNNAATSAAPPPPPIINNLSCIIAVADDGGSSKSVQDGVFKRCSGPAVGDLRSIVLRTASALVEKEDECWLSPFASWKVLADRKVDDEGNEVMMIDDDDDDNNNMMNAESQRRSPIRSPRKSDDTLDWRFSHEEDIAKIEMEKLRRFLNRPEDKLFQDESPSASNKLLKKAVKFALEQGGEPTPIRRTSVGNLALAGILLMKEKTTTITMQNNNNSSTSFLDATVEFARAIFSLADDFETIFHRFYNIYPCIANANSLTKYTLRIKTEDGQEISGQCQISYGQASVIDVIAAKAQRNPSQEDLVSVVLTDILANEAEQQQQQREEEVAERLKDMHNIDEDDGDDEDEDDDQHPHFHSGLHYAPVEFHLDCEDRSHSDDKKNDDPSENTSTTTISAGHSHHQPQGTPFLTEGIIENSDVICFGSGSFVTSLVSAVLSSNDIKEKLVEIAKELSYCCRSSTTTTSPKPKQQLQQTTTKRVFLLTNGGVDPECHPWAFKAAFQWKKKKQQEQKRKNSSSISTTSSNNKEESYLSMDQQPVELVCRTLENLILSSSSNNKNDHQNLRLITDVCVLEGSMFDEFLHESHYFEKEGEADNDEGCNDNKNTTTIPFQRRRIHRMKPLDSNSSYYCPDEIMKLLMS